MIFKDQKLELEWLLIPFPLRVIAEDFATKAKKEFNIDSVVTRILEKIDGSSGVHEDHRGLDFRDQHGASFLFSEEQRIEMLTYINKKYQRFDGKPTIIWHSFNGGAFHFHLQIPRDVLAYVPKT